MAGRSGSKPTSAFQQFFQTEAATGVLLLACALAALLIANSPWADTYHHFWNAPISVDVGGHVLTLSLHGWINDALMAVFFLLVGLEIKREIIAGELSSPRQAALPIAGAFGGMLVPAVLYIAIANGGIESRGWGIPMATDIAFALGTLALVAPRAPNGLKIFLAALAIVDDMGAVLVIAVFYTSSLNLQALGLAALTFSSLLALNRMRVRQLWPYLTIGAGLWFFVHDSGVHATIAGVLLAFTIPTRTRIDAAEFSREARAYLDGFEHSEGGNRSIMSSKGQQEMIHALERASEAVMAPLLRLEGNLHGFTAFVVMPLFAFANAGVTFGGDAPNLKVATGVAVGLLLGKPLGITAAAWVTVRLGLAALPAGVNWMALHGCAWLGGIGFTMSLFIATLAFGGTHLVDAAKLGILGGSLLAGIVGALVLQRSTRRR